MANISYIEDDFHKKYKNTTMLFDFVKNNKYNQLKEYISNIDESEYDINMKDDIGNTLITYIILANKKILLEMILSRGAKIDMIDIDGNSILYTPIKYGYNEILTMILKYDKKSIGISIINIKDKNERVPIFYAIRFKNLFALQELIIYGADVNYKNSKNITALHMAVSYKDYNIFKTIIPYINNINIQNKTGKTALHYSIAYGLENFIRTLIEYGSDVNIQEYENLISPAFTIVINNYKKILDMV